MRRLARWLFPSVLLIFMAGCGCNEPVTSKMVYLIHEGMTVQEVEAILGRPFKVEVIKPVPGSWRSYRADCDCGEIVVLFGPDGKVMGVHLEEPWRFRLPIS